MLRDKTAGWKPRNKDIKAVTAPEYRRCPAICADKRYAQGIPLGCRKVQKSATILDVDTGEVGYLYTFESVDRYRWARANKAASPTHVRGACRDRGWLGERADWGESVPVVGDTEETCGRWGGLGPDTHEVVGVA